MTVRADRVAAVIPAYQAAATLGSVVAGVRRALPGATVIVVDDGSSDDTFAIASAAADHVGRLHANAGKGAALRAGFATALSIDADVVLTLDADGQHEPRYAPEIVAALADADVAIGTRARRGTAMPLSRRATNAISARVMSACTGQLIGDAQSGYRAIRRHVLESVQARGDRYDFESDFLLRAARRGFRLVGVPVSTVYGAKSHFRPFRDALLVMHSIWRHRGGALGRRAARGGLYPIAR